MRTLIQRVWMVGMAGLLSGCLLEPTTRVEPPSASVRRAPQPTSASARPAGATATPTGQYVVRAGDTLYSIAFRHGLDHRRLAEWNRLADPSRIFVGQTLRLTAPASAPAAIPAPRTRVATAPPKPAGQSPGSLAQVINAPSGTQATPPVRAPEPVVVNAGSPSTVPLVDEEPLGAPTPLADAGGAPVTKPFTTPGVSPSAPRPPVSTRPSPPQPIAPVATQPTTAPPQAAAPVDPVVAPATPPRPALAAVEAPVAPLPAVNPNAPSKQVGGVRWRWPTEGKVIGRFVPGDPTESGIDIGGRLGQHVLAAADGEVVYSGNGLLGYGELIIIQHTPEFLSAYGHNQKRLVPEGSKVKAGQPIAEMGRQAGIDLLHFEIRQGGKPVDPLKFLP